MPTYDYKCEVCNYTFEEFHKINCKKTIRCPKCGGIAAKQITLNSGVIFKGSGFYITDYKNNKKDSSSSTKKADIPKSEKD